MKAVSYPSPTSGSFLTKKAEKSFGEGDLQRRNLLKLSIKIRKNVGQPVRQKIRIIVGQSSTYFIGDWYIGFKITLEVYCKTLKVFYNTLNCVLQYIP
jgi:hypothetical protein